MIIIFFYFLVYEKKEIFSSFSVASGYGVMENTLCPCGFLEQQLKAHGGSVLQGSCIAILSTSSPLGIPQNPAPAAPQRAITL